MADAYRLRSALPIMLFVGAGLGILAWEYLRPAVVSQPLPAMAPSAAQATGSAGTQPVASAARTARAEAGTRPGIPRTGEEAMARVVDARRAQENRLLSEQVSPSWARHHEQQVARLLEADALQAAGVEPPLFHGVECRSTLCRVDLVARNQDDMNVTEAYVLEGLSETLDSAELFHETQSDGTVVLAIYARAHKR